MLLNQMSSDRLDPPGGGGEGGPAAAVPAERTPIVLDALKLVEELRSVGAETRMMGGIAIAVRCPSVADPALRRPHDDVDLVATKSGARKLEQHIVRLGYHGEDEFNALQGSRRLIFHSPERPAAKVDVFIERVDMCHTFLLGDRLDVDPLTLSLADLLVLKLQIVELNEKDAQDVAALLLDHPITDDESGINARYLGELAAEDWGIWKTLNLSIDKLVDDAGRLVDGARRERIAAQLARLRAALEQAPKTRRWKLRAKIGERKRWYELPEEVDR